MGHDNQQVSFLRRWRWPRSVVGWLALPISLVGAVILSVGCTARPLGQTRFGDGSADVTPKDGEADAGGWDGATDGSVDGSIDGSRPSSCGNGVAEPGEECDGQDLRGRTCVDPFGYDEGELGCTETCVFDMSACHTCGNGVKEGPEGCDGEDFGEATCLEAAGHLHGALGCNSDCTLDTESCHTCGDGVREGAEECDGADLAGESCESFGYLQGGQLGCTSECLYDSTGCCGDGIKGGTEECDGSDRGGVTCQWLGFDQGGIPGCTEECVIDASSCCGDGTVGGGEQCDDANTTDWDGCGDCEIVEFQINETTTDAQIVPELSLVGQDQWVVVWHSMDQDGDEWGVFGRILSLVGEPMGGEFQANIHTANDQRFPSVAGWESGDFVVTWTSDLQDGDQEGVYARLFDAGGQPIGGEIQVNSYTTGRQDFSEVAALSNDRFIVVWSSEGQDGDNSGVFGKVFEGGVPITGEFQINTYTPSAQTWPSIAVGPDDEVVVVWCSGEQDGDSWGVYGQLLDADGNKIGSEIQVNTYTATGQWQVDVGAFDGGFGVVWLSSLHGQYPSSLWGRMYDWNGAPLTGEYCVSPGDWMPSNPTLEFFGNGSFMAMWDAYGQDGSHQGCFARFFDMTGSPAGLEFQVNEYTSDAQGGASVRVGPNGDAMAVWISHSQDGSGAGIYGQRYDASGCRLGHMP